MTKVSEKDSKLWDEKTQKNVKGRRTKVTKTLEKVTKTSGEKREKCRKRRPKHWKKSFHFKFRPRKSKSCMVDRKTIQGLNHLHQKCCFSISVLIMKAEWPWKSTGCPEGRAHNVEEMPSLTRDKKKATDCANRITNLTPYSFKKPLSRPLVNHFLYFHWVL